ncbi:MAG: thioredoxin [Clostridia bacterium]|nr:thioredoxin [Clostridia bacterium]
MAEITLTKNNFEEEVIRSDVPVLVDFWATWCGPCRMLAPIIEEISEERKDIKVGKINVDDEPALAAKYGIEAIPSVFVFKNGEVAAKSVGYRQKADLLKMLG